MVVRAPILEEGPARLQDMFEWLPFPVAECDGRGVVVRVNAAAARLLQATPSEIEGARWRRFVHPADRSMLRQAVVAALRQRSDDLTTVIRLVGPDGSPVLSRSHIRFERSGAGAVTSIHIAIGCPAGSGESFVDLEAIALESTASAVLLVDHNAHVLDWRGPAPELFDHPRAALLGSSMTDLVASLRGDEFVGRLASLGQTERFHTEFSGRRQTGERFDVALTIGRAWRSRRCQLYVIVAADITDTRRLRRDLAHFQQVATGAKFFGSIGHALNNPLQVVLGNAERLLANGACERRENVARVEVIRDYALRAATVIRGLLLVARQRPLHKTVVFPHAVFESVIAARSDDMADAGVLIERAWDGRSHVFADGPLLEEVFTRLIVNAEEAMRPRGGGTLTLRVEQRTPEMVRASVEDTGPGVAVAVRSRIFDPFYTTKTPSEGAGLGLAICHSIVVEHGGSLTVDEAPSGGAMFVVEMPAEYACGP